MIRVGKMSWREISAMLGSCCSSMLFGLSFMFTKRIVGTVPAFSLLSWRFLMGAVAMSLCALLGVVHIDYKTKKPWPLLRMTLYLPAAYFIFETYGIELTSASESGTIIACIPIFTVLASALFLHEMPSKFQVGGVLLSTVGIVIITLLKGTSPTFNPLGYVLLFGAVFSDVIYFIHNRQLTAYTPVEKTYFMCLTGAVFFTVCALVYNGVHGTADGVSDPALYQRQLSDLLPVSGHRLHHAGLSADQPLRHHHRPHPHLCLLRPDHRDLCGQRRGVPP